MTKKTILIFFTLILFTQIAFATKADSLRYGVQEEFFKGEIVQTEPETRVRIGEEEFTVNYEGAKIGEKFVLNRFEGQTDYSVMEKYRLDAIIIILAIFLLAAVFFGRKKGMGSILGLCLSMLVLTQFILPNIIAGKNPVFISIIGSLIIATVSIYLAHGFSKRTSIALLSTIITLALAGILASVFVPFAKLAGQGSEGAMFLQFGEFANLDLRGLLLGGIIIGVLGILDDITTAQVAAVDEIHKANPKLKFADLYRKGISVGREHIASLINTLVLAYAGASLPLFLLFYTDKEIPLWVTLNSEFLAEEIIRTLIGSLALILAVPISTYLATRHCTEQ